MRLLCRMPCIKCAKFGQRGTCKAREIRILRWMMKHYRKTAGLGEPKYVRKRAVKSVDEE